MNDKMKTFKDLGLSFDFDEDCITCFDGSCHSNVVSRTDGNEYNVYIATTSKFDSFYICVTPINESSNFESEELNFDDESEAVKYLCDSFIGFKCF